MVGDDRLDVPAEGVDLVDALLADPEARPVLHEERPAEAPAQQVAGDVARDREEPGEKD